MPLSVLASAEREAGSGGWWGGKKLGEHHWKKKKIFLFSVVVLFVRLFKSKSPWYNRNGWPGIKHQVTIVQVQYWRKTHKRIVSKGSSHLKLPSLTNQVSQITHFQYIQADRQTETETDGKTGVIYLTWLYFTNKGKVTIHCDEYWKMLKKREATDTHSMGEVL